MTPPIAPALTVIEWEARHYARADIEVLIADSHDGPAELWINGGAEDRAAEVTEG